MNISNKLVDYTIKVISSEGIKMGNYHHELLNRIEQVAETFKMEVSSKTGSNIVVVYHHKPYASLYHKIELYAYEA